jgi:DNA-binding transcriptional MerR regulator
MLAPLMTFEELVDATGMPPRLLLGYIEQGLVPQPALSSTGLPSYGEEHVLRLLAIQRLESEGVSQPGLIGARLELMTTDELRRFVDTDTQEELPESDPPQHSATSRPSTFAPAPAPLAGPLEEWTRLTLRAGLELHLRRDADDEARELFTDMAKRCGMEI